MDTAELQQVDFEHNGFECVITERPDLCYGYKVFGFRKSDDKVFLPKVLFDRDMTRAEIIFASIAMMDGTFTGQVESYGGYDVVVSKGE